MYEIFLAYRYGVMAWVFIPRGVAHTAVHYAACPRPPEEKHEQDQWEDRYQGDGNTDLWSPCLFLRDRSQHLARRSRYEHAARTARRSVRGGGTLRFQGRHQRLGPTSPGRSPRLGAHR